MNSLSTRKASTLCGLALLAVFSGTLSGQTLESSEAAAKKQDDSRSCPAEDTALIAPVVPQYAMLSRIHPEVDCSTGDRADSEDAVLIAMWNPTEMLDRIDPYGLTIDRPLFERLAEADPVAAYLIGLRLERDGHVIATLDMHSRTDSLTSLLTPEYAIWSVFGEPDEPQPKVPRLPDEQRLRIEFRSEFGTETGSRLVVASWVGAAEATQTFSRVRSTVITLMPEASHHAPVIASDSYPSPVYPVIDFAMSTVATTR